ncbi:MAG: hypothetical protein VB023_04650 [Oscillibacter sp.]|nr:hypothetical protein [Oscillibacter sp.]
MKKRSSLRPILLLAALSAAIYLTQILLFRDVKDTAFYLMQDFAFLPVQVALVTVIAGRIINDQEKESRVEKTRMLTGSFFSGVGVELLRIVKTAVGDYPALRELLQAQGEWERRDFNEAARALRELPFTIACGPEHLARLKELLLAEKMPLLVISSNPVLLEHEDFTDMLWAVFHLTDELAARSDLSHLSEADMTHLNADTQRVMKLVLVNWMLHMGYLKAEYPYLFRLEAARNPFLP